MYILLSFKEMLYVSPAKQSKGPNVPRSNTPSPRIEPYFKENLSTRRQRQNPKELVEQRQSSPFVPMEFDAHHPTQSMGLLSLVIHHFNPTYSAASAGGSCMKLFLKICKILCYFSFVGFFVATVFIDSPLQSKSSYWCDGKGLVIVLVVCATLGMIYFNILKFVFRKRFFFSFLKPLLEILEFFRSKKIIRLISYATLSISFLIFLIIDTENERSRLISASGIFALLLFGFLFSKAPLKVIWTQVYWGMAIQFAFGVLILRWTVGKHTFDCLGKHIGSFLAFTDQGSGFVFGVLVTDFKVFAFTVFSVVIFFSFCIHVLYYYGIMQWIIINVGWVLQTLLGTTACESTNAAANIFLSLTEAPLLIKPYLPQMTKSELHAIMTGGFATVAGSVLSAYISFGVDPVHLLSASVMSAPAALAFSKLFYPETETSYTNTKDIKIEKGKESNVLHAAIEGVAASLSIISNGVANLVAFIAFIAFIDAVFGWFCGRINIPDGTCTLSNISGYAFMPLSFIMGVPWEDCYAVGQLIGTKTIVNEFVAYIKLADIKSKCMISKRSEIIATYALCGFSNIGSMGIQVGGIGALAPSRRRDLAQIALRAMIAGSVACFLTACVAGTLISTETLDFGADNCTFRNST